MFKCKHLLKAIIYVFQFALYQNSNLKVTKSRLFVRNMGYSSSHWLFRLKFIHARAFSNTQCLLREKYKLVIIGGGSGGISVAAKFASKLGKGQVAVVEPNDVHYYQPYWTLVGGGIKAVEKSGKPMPSVIPNGAKWMKDSVVKFDPANNMVLTRLGNEISYEFLVVAMGLKLNFQNIKGLPEGFETPGICSNYSLHTVVKTSQAVKDFSSGNAIFTQPPNPIKCAGAPQKIMYLTDSNFRKNEKRSKADIHFFTALGTIFSAPKYAAALTEVAQKKEINIHFQHNLIEVKPDTKEAVFEKLNSNKEPKETVSMKYELIHVVPPMSAPESLSNSLLADTSGFVDVNKYTLQHTKYENIFGIGDCTNVPTSKTAAAVAAQCGVLKNNLLAVMNGKALPKKYDGYTSCPLVTSHNRCILAEFDFDLEPLETFPFNQGVERLTMFYLKSNILPNLYWTMFLNGYWEGPELFRKLFHLGMR